MSAAEKLRALEANFGWPPKVLHEVFPQIVAVVEAMENSILTYADATATTEQNAEIYKRAMAVHDALSALDEKLGAVT